MLHSVSYTLIKYMELKKVHLERNFWVVLQLSQILLLALCEKKVLWLVSKPRAWGCRPVNRRTDVRLSL